MVTVLILATFVCILSGLKASFVFATALGWITFVLLYLADKHPKEKE